MTGATGIRPADDAAAGGATGIRPADGFGAFGFDARAIGAMRGAEGRISPGVEGDGMRGADAG